MSKNVDIFLSNVLDRRPRNSLYLQMHKLGTKSVNFSVRFTHWYDHLLELNASLSFPVDMRRRFSVYKESMRRRIKVL